MPDSPLDVSRIKFNGGGGTSETFYYDGLGRKNVFPGTKGQSVTVWREAEDRGRSTSNIRTDVGPGNKRTGQPYAKRRIKLVSDKPGEKQKVRP